MLIYRFQNTKEIETNSYCEDIMNIFLDYKGDEDVEVTEELVDDVYQEWGAFIDWRLSFPPFEHLSVYEWVEKILSFESEEKVWEFQQQHKMPGIFAVEPTGTIEEAFQLSERDEMGIGNRYLVIAEADFLQDFGDQFGLLVKMNNIIEVYETPNSYKIKPLASK